MKERLTGAIILVALIVLLVPELLSGPKGRFAPASSAPATSASEEPPLRSYTINLGEESRSRTAAAGNNGPAMPQPTGPELPASSSGEPQQSVPQQAASPQANTPEQAPPATTGAPAGSPTRSAEETAAPKPETPPSHESKPAGPAPSASKSVKATQRTKSTHATAVANSAAAKPNKAPAPTSQSQSGWVVQLGVFHSRENAERLAIEVRVKGFKVSVTPLASASGKRYRVRVGAATDRAAAQDLQARLKAAGRPAGTVVPYS